MKTRSRLLLLLCATALTAGWAAGPEKVLVIGDSMMIVTAHATKLALEKRGIKHVETTTKLGTGLARLDAYDWMATIDEHVKTFDPDVSLVWFGTNDRQPMKTDQGIVDVDDAAWEAEYGKRIGQVMDKLTARDGTRVVWLGLPLMKDAAINKEVELINGIAKREADKRESVTYMETQPLLSRKADKFSAYLIGSNGRPIKVRESDGIHLSRAGADLVAEAFATSITTP